MHFLMFQDKELDVTDLGGKGLRLETKEPHFISLGGGRLSVGVSIIPVKMGKDDLINSTMLRPYK